MRSVALGDHEHAGALGHRLDDRARESEHGRLVGKAVTDGERPPSLKRAARAGGTPPRAADSSRTSSGSTPRSAAARRCRRADRTVTAPGSPQRGLCLADGAGRRRLVRTSHTPVTVLTEPAACAGLRESIAANRQKPRSSKRTSRPLSRERKARSRKKSAGCNRKTTDWPARPPRSAAVDRLVALRS
jgi:hypothetical protein